MTGEDTLSHLLDSVSESQMMTHMEEFSRWTKHAGTPEELESLRYVKAQLDDYGYHTELILHDAYISLPGKATIEALGRTLTCITHSFSRASGKQGVSGELVYVGSGGAKDFAGRDVRGKIVLIDGIANPAASLRASHAGAKGQVHISPHRYLHEMCISSVWGSPTHETVKNLPSTAVVTIGYEEGQALKRALQESPTVSMTIHAEVDTGWRKTPILVADMTTPNGADNEPFVFFTGHHDTWYYGVMDNGGANATMLEVARLCAQERSQWQRGLRIVFWSGHSQGRYSSSSWYADELWEELEERATVHVNVDSTGGKGNTVVYDTTASVELHELAREALRTQAGQEFGGKRLGRAGDQAFWGIGVPGIFQNMSEQPPASEATSALDSNRDNIRVGPGTGWWWHTPYDTLDKIDDDILVRDTRIYLFVVWRLLTDPVLPLDYAKQACYLREALQSFQEQLGDRFDLSQPIHRVADIERKAAMLNAIAGKTTSAAVATRINQCLHELSHALVPIDYTASDRFEQDPALGQGVLPTLQPALDLVDYNPESAEFKFLTVGAMRARNRVNVALRQANQILDRFLAELSDQIEA